jgi:hypothetical protein
MYTNKSENYKSMNNSFTTQIETSKSRGAPTFFGKHLFIILTREPDIL